LAPNSKKREKDGGDALTAGERKVDAANERDQCTIRFMANGIVITPAITALTTP
jgi:hypothetical protein